MSKSTYNLLIEPCNQDYYDLLDYAAIECKYVLFVLRDTIQLSSKGRETLKELSKYLYKEKQTDEWPGTKLFNRQARVLEYYFFPEFVGILKTKVSHLYLWRQPDLPEDLCLLRANESAWLVTISHENDGFLVLSDQEKNNLVNVLPRYWFMLKKE